MLGLRKSANSALGKTPTPLVFRPAMIKPTLWEELHPPGQTKFERASPNACAKGVR